MAPKALPDGYHLSLSISQSLWSDLLGQALPVQVGSGDFELVEQGRKLLHMAEDQVKGLLTGASEKLDQAPVIGGEMGKGVRGRIKGVAKRGRRFLSRKVEESVKVTGTWAVKVDKEGSGFTYHEDGVTLEARVGLTIEGRALLLGDQFEIPFTISHDVNGTASLDEVGFSTERNQLEGSLGGVSLSLGDSLPLRLLKTVADRLIEQQIIKMNPLPLIPSSTLENMVLPAGGPLRLSASIADLNVGINGDDLTLSVRFAFKGDAAA
jgi:hypothetical protein